MEYIHLDLQGYRCPDVMQKVLSMLKVFAASDKPFALVRTIEPSAERDVKAALASEYSDSLHISETDARALTRERKEEILSSPQGFDEYDLDGVSTEFLILIAKQ